MAAALSDRMNASALLAQALDGPLIRGEVNRAVYPLSARSYLADGSGVAWLVPQALHEHGRFAVDIERVSPVRPILQRRFGMTSPSEFAQAWTRAEVCAKLLDIPIVVWLKHYGLSFDPHDVGQEGKFEIDLVTKFFTDDDSSVVVTLGALLHL